MRTALAALASSITAAVITAVVVVSVDGDGTTTIVQQAPAAPAAVVTDGPPAEQAQADTELVASTADDPDGNNPAAAETAPATPAPSLGDAEIAGDQLSPLATFDPAEIFERVGPSIVSIQTNTGSGSGFFVDDEGHVVTNFHVIQGAATIFVVTSDGEHAEAELLGVDTANDLATLRIDPDQLTAQPVALADSDDVRVGDPVVAIGTPFNLQNTLTVGVVSAIERDRPALLTGGRPQRGLIQTDAPINPGNSGGALLNAAGELIGITNSVESPVRGSVGIGFAITANTLDRFLPEMIEGIDVQHPWLGVQLDGTRDVITIAAVIPDSPANNAGLQVGDELLSANGLQLDSFAKLSRFLDDQSVGEVVAFEVDRGGDVVTIDVVLGPWPG